jgi:hypothetical protein
MRWVNGTTICAVHAGLPSPETTYFIAVTLHLGSAVRTPRMSSLVITSRNRLLRTVDDQNEDTSVRVIVPTSPLEIMALLEFHKISRLACGANYDLMVAVEQ